MPKETPQPRGSPCQHSVTSSALKGSRRSEGTARALVCAHRLLSRLRAPPRSPSLHSLFRCWQTLVRSPPSPGRTAPALSPSSQKGSNPSLPRQPSVRLPPVRPHLSGTGGTTTGRSTPGAASPAPSRGKGSQPSLHRGRLQPLQTHRANRSPSYLSSPPAGPLQRAESWTRPKHRFLRERRGWERVTEEPPRARRMRAARRLPRGLFPCAAIFGRVERLLRERWGWGVGNCWVSICAGGMAAAFGQGSPRARAGRGGGPFAYLGLRREVRGVTVGSRREFQVFKLEGGLHSCFVQFVGAAVGRENGLLNATAVLHCKGICYFVVFFVCLCFSLCFLPAGIYLDDSVLIPGDSSVCRKETRLSLPLWKSPSL